MIEKKRRKDGRGLTFSVLAEVDCCSATHTVLRIWFVLVGLLEKGSIASTGNVCLKNKEMGMGLTFSVSS